MVTACDSGWQALSGDPLPWLLGDDRPNLAWRVLVELVGRPPSSPAVRRARGGASAAEPVASLLEPLLPDGTWATRTGIWSRYGGGGWRLAAAVLSGADPDDPRLHAAAGRLLDAAAASGGLAPRPGASPSPVLTARALQALAGIGWSAHARWQEAAAWLEEPEVEWGRVGRERATTAAAVLGALSATGTRPRPRLAERAVGELSRALATRDVISSDLGHPNLGRTDIAEALWALAVAAAPLPESARPALRRLQLLQRGGGRWWRTAPVPATLSIPDQARPASGTPSRWVTLKAAVALTHYAVAARLPRRFPAPDPRI